MQMDSLQAMLAAQAPIVEAVEDADVDAEGRTAQASAAVLMGDITSAPLFPLDDEAMVAEAGDIADRVIFAALVTA
jgi:hypothetical protein